MYCNILINVTVKTLLKIHNFMYGYILNISNSKSVTKDSNMY